MNCRGLAIEDDFPRKLAFPGFEVFFFLELRYGYDFRGYRSLGRGRPWGGLADENRGIRRDHVNRGAHLPPTHTKIAPAFQMCVDAAHGGQLIACPGIGLG